MFWSWLEQAFQEPNRGQEDSCGELVQTGAAVFFIGCPHNFPEINTQKLGRKGKFRALLLSKDFPEENPTPLGELNDNHCKYPLGPKLEPAKFFCGRKPVQKDGGRYPYCELHLLVSYVSRNEKEEDSIADEDIPKFLEQRVKKVKSA